MGKQKIACLLIAAVLTASCGDDTTDNQTAGATATTSAPPVTTGSPTSTVPAPPSTTASSQQSSSSGVWEQIADGAPWGPRAGLRVLELDGALFVLGGRTPNDSTIPGDSQIWGDVWRSDDGGRTWAELAPIGDRWAPRAYFQAVATADEMYVLGGQDFGLEPNPFCALLEQGLEPPPGLGIDPDAPCPEFLPTSQFFHDVWASTDGITWEQRTEAAPWAGRAGLSANVLDGSLFVFAGSQNDDSSIIGPNGPERLYYNDVWRSDDGGATWTSVTETAPWAPRAGASTVVRDGEIWLFGGEDGFTCSPLPDCEPPYFNDVWRSADGESWTEVSPAAAWSPRPGHQCELLGEQFVCFGGFGLIENPTDMWSTLDGVTWTELDTAPWNALQPDAVRYDFDSISVQVAGEPTILTVGGDRETFDFDDPTNYLRVEDDVWTFTPVT